MKIQERGPLVRVKGLNTPKPPPEARIQDRLIEKYKCVQKYHEN